MYTYKITNGSTGEVVAEGTALHLVTIGRYSSIGNVDSGYRKWKKRKRQGLHTELEWERTGEPDRKKHKTEPMKPKVTRAQRAASKAWKDGVAADAEAQKNPKRPRYTTEKLGNFGVLPEHKAKFAQPPIEPQGNDISPLRRDVYALELLNWERRKQGKRELSYGEWRMGKR